MSQLKTAIAATSLVDLLVKKGVITYDEYFSYMENQHKGFTAAREQIPNKDGKDLIDDFLHDINLILATK